ncbi:MAG: hypothetical protein AAF413_01775 [Patescibacteria group bacterium]
MSNSLTKHLMVGLTLILSIFAFGAILSGSAAAEGEKFTYTAESGDNLTELVRKSVQLYADGNDITLSAGQVIAAETCVVNTLGAFEIQAGEQVEVPVSEISEAVSTVSSYSDARAQSWVDATGGIDQTLVGVNPTTAPAFVPNTELQSENPDTSGDATAGSDGDAESSDQNSENTNDDASNDQAATETDGDDDGAPWYWWLIGIGAVGAMWYILGGNEIIAERRKNS